MCNADADAHSSRPRTSPEGRKPLEPQHHPCQHPRKNVQRRPSPDPHTTSRRPTPATGPRPARAVRHTAEHFVQRVTDCAQSDLDSSLSAQNVTLRTKRYLVYKTSPHTTPTRTTRNPGCRPARPRRGQLPPIRPGPPTLHRQTPPHPRLNSLKNLRPTPKTRHTTSPPTDRMRARLRSSHGQEWGRPSCA